MSTYYSITQGKVFVKQEEYKEKTIYDDEFERLLNDAEGEGDITDGDIDALAGINKSVY